MKLSLIIPTLNEQINLMLVVKNFKAKLQNDISKLIEVIVVIKAWMRKLISFVKNIN